MSNKYADILSYRPDIKTVKEKVKVSINNNVDTYDVIDDFLDNMPTNNLIKIDNVLEKAALGMKNLHELYFETKYSDTTFAKYVDYVNNNNLGSVNEIYHLAIDDIDSGIELEMYKKINDEYNDVSNFSKMYRIINYGNDDISIKEAENVDISTIESINEYHNKNSEKINYASMNFESKLNKIVELKIELSSLYINTLVSTPLAVNTESIQYDKENIKEISKVLFDDINKEYKDMSKEYDLINSYENFSSLYKFICSKLVQYYEYLDYTESLFKNASDLMVIEIEKLINKKAEEIDFYIIELYKLVAKGSIYIDKFSEVLTKKNEIKMYYKS